MATAGKTIRVTAQSDLAALLDSAAREPIILEHGGERFRLSRADDDPQPPYDPERPRDGLRRFAGTVSAEEGERLKTVISRGREEGSRPLDRP